MRELAKYVDVAIANEEIVQKSFEITVDVNVESGELDREKYRALGNKVLEAYPNMQRHCHHAPRKPFGRLERLGCMPERRQGLLCV